MTDNLPPLPPCALEFKPRWPNDPGGYTAEQMQAYARAAIEKDRERQNVPASQDTANLLARYEHQWHRMGELWERRQGKGWPAKESAEFAQLRDERAPATRAALLAFLAAPQPQLAQQEPVAAQQRFRHPQKTMPDWSPWQPCKVVDRPAWQIDSQGYEVEYRDLYTSPQEAQPLREEPSPISVLLAVEESIKNGECPWQIEQAFDEYEAQRQSAITKGTT